MFGLIEVDAALAARNNDLPDSSSQRARLSHNLSLTLPFAVERDDRWFQRSACDDKTGEGNQQSNLDE
jgi:hypothetical protein